MKVPVAIADLSSGDAPIKEGKLPLHKAVGTSSDFPKKFCRDGKPNVLLSLAEILFKVMPNGIDRPKRRDLRIRFGLGVVASNLAGNFLQEGWCDISPEKPPLHHAILGKLLHENGIFHNRSRPFSQGDTSLMTPDFHNSQVDFRTEPAVQHNFLVAIEFPLFQGGKVEEAELHGFLDLIDVLSRKEYGRNVRLQKIYFGGMVRVDFSSLQGGYERREIHHRPTEQVIFENIKAFPANCQGEKRLTAPEVLL